MKKRTIAVDCDDVIVETAPLIIEHYNQAYGTELELKDTYSHDLARWDAPDIATAVRRIETYLGTEEYQNIAPFIEAIEVIQDLSRRHTLHVVTGRTDFLAAATTDMLARYFPGVFQSVEFTNFFGENSRPKATVCQELGVDVLIDDHLHHATTVAECGVEVLLFGDYPWNQSNALPANVRRVRNWREVASLLS
jgi:uncharacterized HAD superfamily protein